MKKIIFSVLIVLLSMIIYAQSMIKNESVKTCFFENWNIPFDSVYVGINGKKGNLVGELLFEYPDKLSFFYSSSGYYIKLVDVLFFEDVAVIDFIKIWIGAEEYNSGDSRRFYKYRAVLEKEVLEKSESWIVEVYNTKNLFTAIDTANSIEHHNNFFVKSYEEVKREKTSESQSLFALSSKNHFDIIDINCTANDNDDLWLKIKFEEKEGYIPFSSLADNWTVIENNLQLEEHAVTAADLGSYSQKLPVVSVFNSSFLINNSYGYSNGGGNFISLYTENLRTDYKHLSGDSIAYRMMNNLDRYGNSAGIWKFSVPSNYQIGNVGNSGVLSTGVHLHFQNTRVR